MEPSPLPAVNSLLFTPLLLVSLQVALSVCLPVSRLLTAPQWFAFARYDSHKLLAPLQYFS